MDERLYGAVSVDFSFSTKAEELFTENSMCDRTERFRLVQLESKGFNGVAIPRYVILGLKRCEEIVAANGDLAGPIPVSRCCLLGSIFNCK